MSQARNGKASSENWQDRVHEVQFTEPMVKTLDVLIAGDNRPFSDVILDLAVNNSSIKVKSVEYYNSYTVSYTLDKSDPEYPSRTVWFYCSDPITGVRVMSAMVAQMRDEIFGQGLNSPVQGPW